jgi:hypothetical protein
VTLNYAGSLHAMYCTKSHVSFPLPRSYQRIRPGRRHRCPFLNKATFYGEELLAPRPTPKLEDHSLSGVRDCLFNIFADTHCFGGRSSVRNLKTRHAVVTGTHLSWLPIASDSEKMIHVYVAKTGSVHFLARKGGGVGYSVLSA